eukprot:2890965-Rhodomonas_salina.3
MARYPHTHTWHVRSRRGGGTRSALRRLGAVAAPPTAPLPLSGTAVPIRAVPFWARPVPFWEPRARHGLGQTWCRTFRSTRLENKRKSKKRKQKGKQSKRGGKKTEKETDLDAFDAGRDRAPPLSMRLLLLLLSEPPRLPPCASVLHSPLGQYNSII